MTASYVFGYGSLVNPATHDYAETHPASLMGWRRVWRHAAGREVAFLTVVRSPGDQIAGAVARVQEDEWSALHAREQWYLPERTRDVRHHLPETGDMVVYHAPDDLHLPAEAPLPILLSYLDVVVQGYARAFGEEGVAEFFATTDGWHAPVLDDRGAPRYGRHQRLTRQETALTDHWLAHMGVQRI